MNYDFDEIIDRSETDSIKTEWGSRINPYLPQEHIPLWVADMDFSCSPQILSAMRARLDRRILGYTDLGASTKESVVRWMNRRFDWYPSADEIVFSAGIVASLYAAVQRLTDPGDEVCFLTPAYRPFNESVKKQERVPLYSRMVENEDGYYSIDFEDLERKLSRPGCKLFFHCNPHNPTGRVFSGQELRTIGEFCFNHHVLIVSDEIHEDLTRRGLRHIPLAKLFPEERNIITCTSPSKTFNIAGNNHAHLFIPDEALRRDWTKNYYNGHPSALSNVAVRAAYDESEDWLEALRVYLDGSFDAMKPLLQERLPKARFSISEGTYLAWVDLTAYAASEHALKRRVSEAGVFVQFGEDFVDNADRHMRVNLASPRNTVFEGLERICRVLE